MGFFRRDRLGVRLNCVAGALLFLTALSATASADGAGDAVLGKVDNATNRHKSLELTYTMTTQEPGKSQTAMKIRVRMKGIKQFTEISAPPDMKGTKVLSHSPTKMWIYMPQFRKIRRVASHMTEDSFLGTAFAANDMNPARYLKRYEAKVLSQNGSMYELELSPRGGKKATYGKIVMTVEKKRMLPTDFKYYGKAGKHLKTEERRDYRCEKGICQANRMKMTHLAKGGLWSELTLSTMTVNPKLPKRLFSKRNLQR